MINNAFRNIVATKIKSTDLPRYSDYMNTGFTVAYYCC